MACRDKPGTTEPRVFKKRQSSVDVPAGICVVGLVHIGIAALRLSIAALA
jgi:hypothetical protein